MAKKPLDGWVGDSSIGRPSQDVACGNGLLGCGKKCRVISVNKDGIIKAENFHSGVRLCMGCANHAAYEWQIPFDDVDFLMTALHNAKAGKCGVPPTKEEVYALLERMGVQRKQKPLQIASVQD